MNYALSMPPGAIVGYTKNGRPIPFIGGGAPEDEGGGSEGAPAGTGTGAGDGASGTEGDQGGGQPAAGQQGDGSAGAGSTTGQPAAPDDDKTARTIAAIREDFKGERTKRQNAEKQIADLKALMDKDREEREKRDKALAVALGLAPNEEPPDPAKLAAELQEVRSRSEAELARRDEALKAQAVELAVLRVAGGLDANGPLLLDSRSFLTRLAGMDPAADGFAENLTETIKAAVEANPQYKIAKPAEPATKPPATVPRSGGEFNGSPGGNRQWNDEDVRRASPQEVVDAINQGLLLDLGFAPQRPNR